MDRALPTALFLVLAVALAVRVGVVVATPDFQPIFDPVDYDRHARSIAAGDGYPPAPGTDAAPTAYRPPLYPLALSVVYFVGGGWEAGRLLGAVFGVLTVLLVFVIAQELWGRRVALTAGVIAALFPPLVLLNASLLSESLFVPLVLSVVWAILRWRETLALRWAVVAGVLCGLAALTRSVGTLLVLAGMLGVWTARPRLSRRALVAPAALAVAALLTVTPWLVRNALVFERPVPITTQGGYGLAGTYNPESRARPERAGFGQPTEELRVFRDLFERTDLDEAARSNLLARRALEYALEHPGYTAETWFWNTLRVFDLTHDVDFESGFAGVFLMALGVDRVVTDGILVAFFIVLGLSLLGVAVQLGMLPGRRAPPIVWACPLLMLVPAIGVFGLARYRVPVDPFIVMLAAVGVVALAEQVRVRPDGQMARTGSGSP